MHVVVFCKNLFSYCIKVKIYHSGLNYPTKIITPRKMVFSRKAKPQLPKSVLDMKFMKKTKDRIEKELANTQGHEDLYSNIITDEMRHASGNFISEHSFMFCEDLMDGRLSFKGMNPEIERLMELENVKNEPTSEMEKDVTDEILAKKMTAFKRNRSNSPQTNYSYIKKRK